MMLGGLVVVEMMLKSSLTLSVILNGRYWGFEGGSVASVWLALDDVDRENGVLQVIPGTATHTFSSFIYCILLLI